MNTFALQRRRVTLTLLSLFVILALVAVFLVAFSFNQLSFESALNQRKLADAYADGVQQNLIRVLQSEAQRPPEAYAFTPLAAASSNTLSTLTPDSAVPGLLHFFQITAAGEFSTPLLPAQAATPPQLNPDEVTARRALQSQLRELFRINDAEAAATASRAPAPTTAPIADQDAVLAGAPNAELLEESQRVFSQLSQKSAKRNRQGLSAEIAQVADLKLNTRPARPTESAPQMELATIADEAETRLLNVSQSPFTLTTLGPAHYAIHRDVWLNGTRQIQGFVVNSTQFLQDAIQQPFATSPLSQHNDLTVALSDQVISQTQARAGVSYNLTPADVAGSELILQRNLPPPFNDLAVIITSNRLPLGAGFNVLMYTTAVLFILMLSGFFLLKRLSNRTIDVAQQQQNFVAAVTHELKTPLTSIRMYGEILRGGWADEEKRKTYYDFIFFESERLSRLVSNVLQLARITHGNEQELNPKPHRVGQLCELINTQITAQTAAAGFELETDFAQELHDLEVLCEPDAVQQVLMNLVDNAIKFAAVSEPRRVSCGTRRGRYGVEFFVRDYGPGIDKAKMKKIFELFFRGEDERTRETSGTGIGLALVATLVEQMDGKVDVVNKQPGAEFRVTLTEAGR
ncbi:MAG: HAMP domain-containing sensor histidine kinase [Pseudomonadota bacterium]